MTCRVGYTPVIGILLISIVLRVVLIFHGGQLFDPDEDRYMVSRDAAALLAKGQLREGLTLPLESGDHVGYKFIGLLPAMIEQLIGADLRIPAFFFGSFSVVNLVLLWLIARRVEPTTELWTLFLAACCSTLFYPARHILPFDASMAFDLTALFIGLRRQGNAFRSVSVGFIATLGFIVYFGYWTLSGVVVLLHLLYARDKWCERVKAMFLAGVGSLAALSLPVILNQFGSGQMLARARGFSGTIKGGDFRGHIVPWEFLHQAEGLLFWITAVAAVVALARGLGSLRRKNTLADAGFLFALGVLVIWLAFVLTGSLWQKFSIYARLVRQLTPFLCLAGGLEIARVGVFRRSGIISWTIALCILADAGWRFRVPLSQEFPKDFLRRGEAVIKNRQLKDTSEHYYRFVNVEKFIYEPEVLKIEPVETVLARPHPFQYLPYLYEGETPEFRTYRRSVDHRMRLVKMPVPPHERIAGDAHGAVKMVLRFAHGRTGFSEPLLSIGPRGSGDLFFVRYVGQNEVVYGVEALGLVVHLSRPVPFEAGKDTEVTFFSGSLLPSKWEPGGNISEAEASFYKDSIIITTNSRVVLTENVVRPPIEAEEVYAGLNRVNSGSADTRFSGEIRHIERGGWPLLLVGGALDMAWRPPQRPAAGAQVLFSADASGQKIEGFARWFSAGRVRLGLAINGTTLVESDNLHLEHGQLNRVSFSFGSLYPPVGAAQWGDIPVLRQQELKELALIYVNGKNVVCRPLATPDLPPTVIYVEGASAEGTEATQPELADGIVGIQRKLPVGIAESAPNHRLANQAGPVKITLRFPQKHRAVSEPLLVTGRAGAGDLVYVIYEDEQHIRIGWDHWGGAATVSELLPIRREEEHTIVVESSALMRRKSEGENITQKQLDERGQQNARVILDGNLVLNGLFSAYPLGADEIFVGMNPIGGSTCTERFGGSILSAERLLRDLDVP